MSTPENFVAYIVVPPRRNSTQFVFSQQALDSSKKRIDEFMQSHPNGKLLKTFIELGENHRPKVPFAELQNAISYCLESRAHLVVAEIKNLTSNESFAKHIFHLITPKKDANDSFISEIYCCDQPFIKKDNFEALVEHAKQQKEIHGQLIKAGLKRTTAKSGNPHASEVISKVNKPKVDSAIIFALMLQPIILDYRMKNYSQRQMVAALNQEGFLAPEGGHWVLSQLQKVLDRMKLNELALTLESQLKEYQNRKYDNQQIAQSLQALSVPTLKGPEWTTEMVEKVLERTKQLHEIIDFNDFVIELIPILRKYHVDELTDEILANELLQLGVNIPPPYQTQSRVISEQRGPYERK